tara:strand:- start:618 stop:1034 length:417 start_codon:yes stop_codon:yes gene_type:complete
MSRGRPIEQTERRTKYVLEFIDVPSKPELGGRQLWHFDDAKHKNGAWKVENYPGPEEKKSKYKPKIQKGKSYNNMPVVMVFKSSNRSNAKTKMKVWNNENVDYIITAKKLPGVPNTSIILELGVGKSFIKKWQLEYNL